MGNGTLLTGPLEPALAMSMCSGQSYSVWLCPSHMLALVFPKVLLFQL